MNKGSDLSISKPFGLYLHIPFCNKKCNYCDFYSEIYSSPLIDRYLEAIKREISLYQGLVNSKVYSIYLGGGTPSLLSPQQVAKLLDKIIATFSEPLSSEITMEANPSSLNKEKIKEYRKAGINRLSLGVQSLQEKELDILGRIHTSSQALNIIEEVLKEFENLNLDLIFAIPGQTLFSWESTLSQILEFKPTHLSIYNLQIEENTPLLDMIKRGKINKVDNELDAAMYLQARQLLQTNGYQHYEISNFASGELYSHHNKLYWEYKPYLGLGPAAHSFTGEYRFNNFNNLGQYLSALADNKSAIEEVIELSTVDRMSEMIFMGLRLREGILLKQFRDTFQISLLEVYQEEIKELTELKLIEQNDGRLRLTEQGLLLGNYVFLKFINLDKNI